jgi:hypothetical protein
VFFRKKKKHPKIMTLVRGKNYLLDLAVLRFAPKRMLISRAWKDESGRRMEVKC